MNKQLQNAQPWGLPVVQGLGLCTLTAERVWVQFLVGELRFRQAAFAIKN